jgi:hypothetical protein
MKTRIVTTLSALALLGLLACFGPAIIRQPAGFEHAAPRRASASATPAEKLRRMRGNWSANARTLISALRFIFSASPPETGSTAVAANGAKIAAPGRTGAKTGEVSYSRSNHVASVEGTGADQAANGISFASNATIASRFGDGRGDVFFYRWPWFDLPKSLYAFDSTGGMSTNAHNSSNAPAATFKSGLIDSTEGPG